MYLLCFIYVGTAFLLDRAESVNSSDAKLRECERCVSALFTCFLVAPMSFETFFLNQACTGNKICLEECRT